MEGAHLILALEDLEIVSVSSVTQWGEALSLIDADGERFFVGAQLAALLKRMSSNLYGILRRSHIEVLQADDAMRRWLMDMGGISRRTSALSLVKVDAVSGFVDDAMQKMMKRRGRLDVVCVTAVLQERVSQRRNDGARKRLRRLDGTDDK